MPIDRPRRFELTLSEVERATGNDVRVRPPDARLPVLDGEHITLVVAGNTVVAGSSDFETLTGLDASTGAQRWQLNPRRGSILDLMTVADGVVYLAFLTGQVSAIDPVGGQILWSTAEAPSLTFWTYPAVGATRLYASAQNGFYSLKR